MNYKLTFIVTDLDLLETPQTIAEFFIEHMKTHPSLKVQQILIEQSSGKEFESDPNTKNAHGE